MRSVGITRPDCVSQKAPGSFFPLKGCATLTQNYRRYHSMRMVKGKQTQSKWWRQGEQEGNVFVEGIMMEEENKDKEYRWETGYEKVNPSDWS